jgi:hypothetical protein
LIGPADFVGLFGGVPSTGIVPSEMTFQFARYPATVRLRNNVLLDCGLTQLFGGVTQRVSWRIAGSNCHEGKYLRMAADFLCPRANGEYPIAHARRAS